jgi:hypothetical protein
MRLPQQGKTRTKLMLYIYLQRAGGFKCENKIYSIYLFENLTCHKVPVRKLSIIQGQRSPELLFISNLWEHCGEVQVP